MLQKVELVDDVERTECLVLSYLGGTVPLTFLEGVSDGGELRKLDKERLNHPLKVSKEGPKAECPSDTLLPVSLQL